MTSRGPRRPSGPGGPGARRGRPRYYARRKVCSFCVDHIDYIDYKNVERARAIKRARHLAMLPFSPDHRVMDGVRAR